jgi:DNA mismatch repair protein MutS
VLAILDVLVSFAEVARSRGWVRPTISTAGELVVEAGRHPVLEELLPAGTLVANDLALTAGGEAAPAILLVTGPNMGGKSTFIRQAALVVVMAQAGSFVPARRATVGIVDRLFARIGAGDDLARGASTFLVEMAQTAAAMRAAELFPRSLCILDEVGRGTSTCDGTAIAVATLRHWARRLPARLACVITHFPEVARAAEEEEGCANLHMAHVVDGEKVAFLYTLERGPSPRSFGLNVARTAGLPVSESGVVLAGAVLAQLPRITGGCVTPAPE